jgi:hypothetical protein
VDRESDLEALLAAIRPEPPDEFVDALEQRLIGSPKPSRFAWRRRPLAAAVAGVAGLAGVLVAVSLAGLSPFSDDPSVDAVPECTTTLTQARVREPVVVTRADGTETIVKQTTIGTKPVRVCSTTDR